MTYGHCTKVMSELLFWTCVTHWHCWGRLIWVSRLLSRLWQGVQSQARQDFQFWVLYLLALSELVRACTSWTNLASAAMDTSMLEWRPIKRSFRGTYFKLVGNFIHRVWLGVRCVNFKMLSLLRILFPRELKLIWHWSTCVEACQSCL